MSYYIMTAAMLYDEADGISKKICMQASALSYNNSLSALICLGRQCILKLSFSNGNLAEKKEIAKIQDIQYNGKMSVTNEFKAISVLLDAVRKEIICNKPNLIYIRHMIPQFKLVSVLKTAQSRGVRVGYEIPTYPYYREQLNVSQNKIKTLVKLGLETFFWPFIYKNINKLFAIRCSSKSPLFKKMVSIKNGYSGEKHDFCIRNIENLNMIGVGTIYPYHGYDRIIEAMKKCNCKLRTGGEIFFHIVGQSNEIENLKTTIDSKTKEHVIFHGVKYGEELEKLYREANLGVGTLKLSLRNADIDTAIKNIEYLSYYLPVISSGNIFDLSGKGLYYKVIKESKNIDFNKIALFVWRFYNDTSNTAVINKELFDFRWSNIMDKIKTILSDNEENINGRRV